MTAVLDATSRFWGVALLTLIVAVVRAGRSSGLTMPNIGMPELISATIMFGPLVAIGIAFVLGERRRRDDPPAPPRDDYWQP